MEVAKVKEVVALLTECCDSVDNLFKAFELAGDSQGTAALIVSQFREQIDRLNQYDGGPIENSAEEFGSLAVGLDALSAYLDDLDSTQDFEAFCKAADFFRSHALEKSEEE